MMLFTKYDFVGAFIKVVDMVNAGLSNHHQRTAYLADLLCRRLKLDQADHQAVVLAALMHDIGVVPLRIKADDLLFEKDMEVHSWAGWMMLRSCPALKLEAGLVKYHHWPWTEIKKMQGQTRKTAELANVINLADHLDIVSRSLRSMAVVSRELKHDPSAFVPDHLDAALALVSEGDLFVNIDEAAKDFEFSPSPSHFLSMEEIIIFSKLFAELIDSRSPFTASHSNAVAHIALYLHQLAALPEDEAPIIFMAGLLHDIGKLAVPLELIEKESRLTGAEMEMVRRHAAISWETLTALPGFHRVAVWGALHHERLNGAGYPFGLSYQNLSIQSRLMAVADVLTALTEERPYRPGFRHKEVVEILTGMAKSKLLDADMVDLACQLTGNITLLRRLASDETKGLYNGQVGASDMGKDGRRQLLGNSPPPPLRSHITV